MARRTPKKPPGRLCFVLDEGMPPSAAEYARSKGYEVTHAGQPNEYGVYMIPKGTDDYRLVDSRCLLVSKDIRLPRDPRIPKQHAGIIILEVHNAPEDEVLRRFAYVIRLLESRKSLFWELSDRILRFSKNQIVELLADGRELILWEKRRRKAQSRR